MTTYILGKTIHLEEKAIEFRNRKAPCTKRMRLSEKYNPFREFYQGYQLALFFPEEARAPQSGYVFYMELLAKDFISNNFFFPVLISGNLSYLLFIYLCAINIISLESISASFKRICYSWRKAVLSFLMQL